MLPDKQRFTEILFLSQGKEQLYESCTFWPQTFVIGMSHNDEIFFPGFKVSGVYHKKISINHGRHPVVN